MGEHISHFGWCPWFPIREVMEFNTNPLGQQRIAHHFPCLVLGHPTPGLLDDNLQGSIPCQEKYMNTKKNAKRIEVAREGGGDVNLDVCDTTNTIGNFHRELQGARHFEFFDALAVQLKLPSFHDSNNCKAMEERSKIRWFQAR